MSTDIHTPTDKLVSDVSSIEDNIQSLGQEGSRRRQNQWLNQDHTRGTLTLYLIKVSLILRCVDRKLLMFHKGDKSWNLILRECRSGIVITRINCQLEDVQWGVSLTDTVLHYKQHTSAFVSKYWRPIYQRYQLYVKYKAHRRVGCLWKVEW